MFFMNSLLGLLYQLDFPCFVSFHQLQQVETRAVVGTYLQALTGREGVKLFHNAA